MSHLEELVSNAINAIDKASNIATLDVIRVKYFGKKGFFSLQTNVFRKLTSEQKRERGVIINKAKKQIKQALDARKFELENAALGIRLSKEVVDVSLPGRRIENGGFHPITNVINRIEDFFSTFGFKIVMGPEIEDAYYNFDALNIPSFHPSRAEHDTFWFDSTRLLRTQTSSMQIRIMRNHSPPVKIISPGRVYRNDYDQTHTPMFHQIEGFFIDKNVNFRILKGILYNFLCNFFEKKDLQINFRPSYFPFTEPSSEVDIMNKNGKWIEIMGCGMIHPNVLNNVGINPEIYSGFAFGMGVERLAMLRYGVSDLRMFFENDLRFLKQFK